MVISSLSTQRSVYGCLFLHLFVYKNFKIKLESDEESIDKRFSIILLNMFMFSNKDVLNKLLFETLNTPLLQFMQEYQNSSQAQCRNSYLLRLSSMICIILCFLCKNILYLFTSNIYHISYSQNAYFSLTFVSIHMNSVSFLFL